MKKNIFLIVLTLFLSSFSLVACGNSKNTAKQEANNSQQNVNSLFEKAQNLFDQDKYEDAYKIFKQLADQGDAKAQNALGNGYQHGFWGNVDFDNAIYWYNKAIEKNEPHAAYNLASLYEKGNGVKQDFDLAYAYYTLAKEFGLDVAQKKLLELDSKVVKENIRILKNGDNIQIAIDDPSSKWEIMDEEDYLKKNGR
ncbi:tetratricopeptide repeat protein [Acinetobacter sp. COS3]|uniref:tetratricopeptide repeat protein n=1 Tax=Acinetobacter sp. COS3 TaxID=1397525 RepID=UPI001D0D0040|nr:tetratricopeptide repeat protein [Acinetobacter sp. COS3]